ncbi:MAG: hemerythrin domain-containing protein [Planctomycetota bacterium]
MNDTLSSTHSSSNGSLSNQSDHSNQSDRGLPPSRAIGGLTINAAFLQEIKEDNRHLKELWDRLLPMVTHVETARNHWADVQNLLPELLDQLAMHFSLEEAYGYFDDAVDAIPSLSLQAETLRSQHANLFTQARLVAEKSGGIASDDREHIERWIRQFESFQRAFEQHEESELKLILQSFEDEVGVDD